MLSVRAFMIIQLILLLVIAYGLRKIFRKDDLRTQKEKKKEQIVGISLVIVFGVFLFMLSFWILWREKRQLEYSWEA